MKIWILSTETPFYNPGGIARYADNFGRFLAAQGHEVLVISRGEEEGLREITRGFAYYSFVPAIARAGEPAASPAADAHPAWPYNILDYWTALSFEMAQRLQQLAKEHGAPDVIEAQEYTGLPYYLTQRRLTDRGYFEHTPVVVNVHSPDSIIRRMNEEPQYQFPHYWNGQLEKSAMLAADAVICPSRYLADQVEQLMGDPAFKVRNFPLPWTPVESAEPQPGQDRDVLYFGRMEVRKGSVRLLRECEHLWNAGESFRLTLIGGDTPYVPRDTTVRSYLEKRYAHRIESGQLQLENALPHADLLERVRHAGFVVIPSVWENWPNTCIEAMSLQKAVVASVHGGQAEMLGHDGKAGLLFNWDDPDSFGEVFRTALNWSADQRKAMGSEARARIARQCAPEQVIPTRLEHFQQVIDARQPRRIFPFLNRHLRESDVNERIPEVTSKTNLVSAVVPFYNLGTFVEETVDSILASDYPELEVVVVNDGSTEADAIESLNRLKARGDARIRVVDIANRGLANARNVGAEAAQGAFLALVDADDQLEPAFISRAVDVIRRYDNVHIVFSWERYFESSQDIYPGWNFEFPYLLGHNMTAPLSVVRRDAFLAFGRNKPKMVYNFEDYEAWISMVAAGCGGVCLHEPLVRYRIRQNSLWQGSSRRQHLYLWEQIVEEHPELYQRYGAELFCLQNANGASQEWLKPAAASPYDQYVSWSRGEIKKLREQRDGMWHEKEAMHKRLLEAENRVRELEQSGNQAEEFEKQKRAVEAELERLKSDVRRIPFRRFFGVDA